MLEALSSLFGRSSNAPSPRRKTSSASSPTRPQAQAKPQAGRPRHLEGYQYDVFISCGDADLDAGHDLADRLTALTIIDKIDGCAYTRPLRVFLDHTEEGASLPHALSNSLVVVAILSPKTFGDTVRSPTSPKRQSPTGLKAAVSAAYDYVLVEHSMALELLELGRVRTLVPLFIEDHTNARKPQRNAVWASQQKALRWLEGEGFIELPEQELHMLKVASLRKGRTAEETYGAVCGFHGTTMKPSSEASCAAAASLVQKVAEEVALCIDSKRQRLECARSIVGRLQSPKTRPSLSHDDPDRFSFRVDDSRGPAPDEALWVACSAIRHEDFGEDLHEWVRDFLEVRSGTAWTLCSLLLAGFVVDPQTAFRDFGAHQEWFSACRRACVATDGPDLVLLFDAFVRDGRIRSPRLEQWGCAPARRTPADGARGSAADLAHRPTPSKDPHSSAPALANGIRSPTSSKDAQSPTEADDAHPETAANGVHRADDFPRASFEVITRLVLEGLTGAEAETWQQDFAEKWRSAAGPSWRQWLADADQLLETMLMGSLGIQGLGSILTTGDYGDFVLFLRVPRLVGLLIWQWLTYRHFTGLPELGFQVLASSTGDVLPQLYNWDQAMALDLPVVLQRLADLPQNLKDAESWSLMDLEAEDSSTWPWESAHAEDRQTPSTTVRDYKVLKTLLEANKLPVLSYDAAPDDSGLMERPRSLRSPRFGSQSGFSHIDSYYQASSTGSFRALRPACSSSFSETRRLSAPFGPALLSPTSGSSGSRFLSSRRSSSPPMSPVTRQKVSFFGI